MPPFHIIISIAKNGEKEKAFVARVQHSFARRNIWQKHIFWNFNVLLLAWYLLYITAKE